MISRRAVASMRAAGTSAGSPPSSAAVSWNAVSGAVVVKRYHVRGGRVVDTVSASKQLGTKKRSVPSVVTGLLPSASGIALAHVSPIATGRSLTVTSKARRSQLCRSAEIHKK